LRSAVVWSSWPQLIVTACYAVGLLAVGALPVQEARRLSSAGPCLQGRETVAFTEDRLKWTASTTLYRSGQLKLDELATRTYKLEDINAGYQDMREGRNLRGVISF
jgi:hypothetical protein